MKYVNCRIDNSKCLRADTIKYLIDTICQKYNNCNKLHILKKIYKSFLKDEIVYDNLKNTIIISVLSLRYKEDHKFTLTELREVKDYDIYNYFNHLRNRHFELPDRINKIRYNYFQLLHDNIVNKNELWDYAEKKMKSYSFDTNTRYNNKYHNDGSEFEELLDFLSSGVSLEDIKRIENELIGDKNFRKNQDSHML